MVFDASIVDISRSGIDVIASGDQTAVQSLLQFSGGHRWQRIPPNEKRGRVHTSTVTVAVLELNTSGSKPLNLRDVQVETMRGSGAGGQHRNVTDSAVRVRHLPTGLEAICCTQRSQHQNKASALLMLEARVRNLEAAGRDRDLSANRKGQIGSGMRGDKSWTYRVRDDTVVDHTRNRKLRLKDVLLGQFN